MRNNIATFDAMAINTTNTYQLAKTVFETLALKEDMYIELEHKDLPTFRKHLSEMIKRKKSCSKFASRYLHDGRVKIIRID